MNRNGPVFWVVITFIFRREQRDYSRYLNRSANITALITKNLPKLDRSFKRQIHLVRRGLSFLRKLKNRRTSWPVNNKSMVQGKIHQLTEYFNEPENSFFPWTIIFLPNDLGYFKWLIQWNWGSYCIESKHVQA